MISVSEATLTFGERTLFRDLDLSVSAGEFIAVLGPNGAGKTSLLKILLGLEQLTTGSISICGKQTRDARSHVGYIPQQHAFASDLPIRGRDLVQFGLDGTKKGLSYSRKGVRERVDVALQTVDALNFADAPLGELSGGEQQRLRIAQALLTNPDVLLCDEPLLSLDPSHQHNVCELINQRRKDHNTAVVFVTHEINPVLPYVDRVLYLAGGQWAIGTPGEVITTQKLSELYSAHIEVLDIDGRIVIVGGDAQESAHHHHDHGVH